MRSCSSFCVSYVRWAIYVIYFIFSSVSSISCLLLLIIWAHNCCAGRISGDWLTLLLEERVLRGKILNHN